MSGAGDVMRMRKGADQAMKFWEDAALAEASVHKRPGGIMEGHDKSAHGERNKNEGGNGGIERNPVEDG